MRPSPAEVVELRRIVTDDSEANYVWSIWRSSARKLINEIDALTSERNQSDRDYARAVIQRDEARKRLHEFAHDIATNYDHDADAHRYGHEASQCRVCKAEALIASGS